MKINRLPSRLLKKIEHAGTLMGGTGGSDETLEEHPSSASSALTSTGELVVALDSALGALTGMFAAALRPDSTGARGRLDRCYETLITSVEAFRETVPKA